MSKIGERAVVLGAGIAGLLAARVLSEKYEEVTLVDRDPLDGSSSRRGVPQGNHVHALLPRGQEVLDELFPVLADELIDGGVPVARVAADMDIGFGGERFVRAPHVARMLLPSRPHLESCIRRRVLALPEVSARTNHNVAGLVADERRERIIGARIVPQTADIAEDTLAADLVVDATGRSGRASNWLAELGYPTPSEERIKSRLGYASRQLRMPPDALDGDLAVLVGPYPGCPRGMSLFAQEGDRWLLTLAGLAGTRPPTDPDGFLEYAASVAPPHVFRAIRNAEPLGEIVGYQFPAQQRRRYERLASFPEGLLVMGDAICSLNPIYGQGMSVAALEALRLRECLGSGAGDVARRFFRAAAKEIEPAWQAAVGADMALPEVEGERPLPIRMANAWTARVQAAATHDPAVAAAFIRVIALLDPPSALLRPAVAARVLRRRRRSRRPHRPSEQTIRRRGGPTRT